MHEHCLNWLIACTLNSLRDCRLNWFIFLLFFGTISIQFQISLFFCRRQFFLFSWNSLSPYDWRFYSCVDKWHSKNLTNCFTLELSLFRSLNTRQLNFTVHLILVICSDTWHGFLCTINKKRFRHLKKNLCLLSVSMLMLNWEMLLLNNTEWLAWEKKRVVIKNPILQLQKKICYIVRFTSSFCFSCSCLCQQPNNTRFSDSSSPGHKAEIKVGRFISQK